MREFFVIITFLIVYGSLYPFNFEFTNIQMNISKGLFNFNILKSSFSDSISNIILFIPYGFLLFNILAKQIKAKVTIVLLISFVFAYFVQILQLLTPERVPSGADAVLNTIGAFIGILLTYLTFPKSPYIDKIRNTKAIVPLVLTVSLILLNLAPFMPAIDFYAFKKSIKALIYSPSFDMFWVLKNTTLWLVSFLFLRQACFPKQSTHFLCFMVMTVLMTKLFIQGGGLNYNHLLGGVIALFIWHSYKEYLTPRLLSVLLIAMLLGLGLHPFEFSAEISSFHWLPFEGGLNGNILINIIALIKKTVLYISLIYMLYLGTNSLLKASIISASLVFVSEYLQIFFTNSVAEITDAILVLLSGYCIHLIHKHIAEGVTNNTGEACPEIGHASLPLIHSENIQEQVNNQKSFALTCINGLRALVNNDIRRKAPLPISQISFKLRYVFVTVLVVLLFNMFTLTSQNPIIESPSWANKDATVVFDHHTHTTYSDGSLSLAELVELAYIGSCNALAITDHSSKNSINEKKLAEIAKLRKQYPFMKIINGIELGMPSYEGREHVNFLMLPENEKEISLNILKQLLTLDVIEKPKRDSYLIEKLNTLYNINETTLGIYNHPSRKDETETENLADIKKWNNTGLFINALSGAPGHQKRPDQVGSYRTNYQTIDRWDPVVANINGTWDQLLDQGDNIYGAIASSDFHNYAMDEVPCSFSRIHLAVKDDSYESIFESIKRGTFWADHGHILEQLKFSVSIEAREKSFPGAQIYSEINDVASVDISFKRGVGSLGKPLTAEVISNCVTGKPELIATKYVQPEALNATMVLPILSKGIDQKSCYIRSRVRLENIGEDDYMAVSNHIRIYIN